MKKIAILTAMMMVGTGAAFAASLTVPFFLDSGAANGALTPTTGSNTFIAVKNNTTADITVNVYYTKADGSDTTPAENSFTLLASQVLGFRPGADDTAAEGPGAIVPNSTFNRGSARFEWVGSASDIQGRLAEYQSNGSFSYLLPPGIE